MPPIIKVSDQKKLVETSKFPLAKLPFKNFNPIQSRVYDYYDKDMNALIAASTSSGKTLVAEMYLSHEIRENKRKGMYLAPLRALAQEKIDDWLNPEHHFSDLNISICTGDYRLTPERQNELNNADLIIMTSEMLNHLSRNKSQKSEFLKDIGVLVTDEFHLVGVKGRGDHLECGLMKFSEINPTARHIMLSATMPNVEEMGEWVSYSLTGKETYVLCSDYRPCPLTVNYVTYDKQWSYDKNEEEKVATALGIIDEFPDDKFLVFVHTKKTGEMVRKSLQAMGIECGYHNADLNKEKRVEVENRFKEDPNLRVIVATSTLAAGINMPARRVIVVGVHRGIQIVETCDIKQMCGRAGRPKYDPMGDAYILIPSNNEETWKKRLETSDPIRSQLLEQLSEDSYKLSHYKTLAFHLVSEIHHGGVKDDDDIHAWYERSLAYFQEKELGDKVIDETVKLLKSKGVIYTDDNGNYKVTSVGVISSIFYFSPFDASDLRNNFRDLFADKLHDNDYAIAMALANIDTHRLGIVSKAEMGALSLFKTRVDKMFGSFPDPTYKPGYCYFMLLNGQSNSVLSGFMRNLQFDFPRVNQVLLALNDMCGKWGEKEWIKRLGMRMNYGVGSDLIELCQLPNIGKARANKLFSAGIKTPEDILVQDVVRLKRITGLKEVKIIEILDAAKVLMSRP